ncbi:DUF2255 family protein [Microbacterium sp. 4R-513]|uniref:DUF2255 family protein n=1 Tax=Microbacterium sp. 4R-513 TaxID=2567934 RepID=UPI0019D1CCC2|nr:DUF2255 family protein [Microbacterium sp. 4R-513]
MAGWDAVQDGTTYGTPTGIWSVVVDGELYVRAWHGTGSRWYQAAVTQHRGRIRVAGHVRKVRFEQADASVGDAVDDAYRTKYAGSLYLPPIIGSGPQAATVPTSPSRG